MKKLTAILLALCLTLSCGLALAERIEISIDTTVFTLAFDKPDDINITTDSRDAQYVFIEMYYSDDPTCAYYLIVSPLDTYSNASMSELSDAELEEYKAAYISDMDAPTTMWISDSASRKWLYIDENGSSYDSAEAGTIIRGYAISLSAFNEDFSELSTAQTDRIKQLIEMIITTEM